MDELKLLPPREAARIFGVSTETIARWARDGKLPHTTTPTGHRRYDPAEIAKLLDQSESGRLR